jgi:NAD(P)-dependent dehydrogenase (short-subunit alcohol dehydrogenase family)
MNGAAKVYSIDIGEAGEEFQALYKRFPGQLFSISANVTQEEHISAAVNTIIEEAGAIHGMVVNAGRTHHKAALDFTKEEIENLFNVNVCFCIRRRGATNMDGKSRGWLTFERL